MAFAAARGVGDLPSIRIVRQAHVRDQKIDAPAGPGAANDPPPHQ
jgi:hypothetical protein